MNQNDLTAPDVGDATWKADAACAGHPEPDMFYPEPKDFDTQAEARHVCSVCPVRAECLLDALALNDREGVRGGLTKAERRPWHNRMRAAGGRRRVIAVLARDKPQLLSKEDRDIAVEVAFELGLPTARLARALGISNKWARHLLNGHAEGRQLDGVAPQTVQDVADLLAERDTAQTERGAA
jgi:WhiB family redox-sensing transcriptional regulator